MMGSRQADPDRRPPSAPAAANRLRRWLWILSVLVLAESALVLAPLAGRQPPLDVPGIAAAARPAVVTVLADTPLRLLPGKTGGEAALAAEAGEGIAGLFRRGSGFVIDPAGLIATNHHVVAGAGRTAVRFADGRLADAEFAGRDPRTDLALLRVRPERPLPALAFADSAGVRIGEPVIVIGDPFGYAGSVSSGIVSGVDRTFDEVDPIGFLQHDAALNPGNSGGPALDASGKVVGINTAIPDHSFFGSGVGLAIPANEAKRILAELAARGFVERARLGVSVQALEQPLAAALGVAGRRGCVVAAVEDGSPAATAGIAPGDVIVAVDGGAVATIRDLNRALIARRPGDPLEITVARRDGEVRLRTRLDPAPPPPAAALPVAAAARAGDPPPAEAAGLGLAFEDQIRGKGRHDGRESRDGLRIRQVDPESLGERIGLAAGDRVLAVGSTRVDDARHFARLVDAAPGDLALLVRRDGEGQQFIVVPRGDADGGPASSWGNRGGARAGPF
jgi:S1-C subfamily serine protease